MSAAHDANARRQRGVALEDAVDLEQGVLAPSNATMVEKVRGTIEACSR